MNLMIGKVNNVARLGRDQSQSIFVNTLLELNNCFLTIFYSVNQIMAAKGLVATTLRGGDTFFALVGGDAFSNGAFLGGGDAFFGAREVLAVGIAFDEAAKPALLEVSTPLTGAALLAVGGGTKAFLI